ncbi:hypothetical protein [Longimicrobium sp.]|jgi:hypothetical protein|uniref:hypothetical protein n=1 Tax=Longimicrobium sp. TaxID=2029185 RepID=UPI002ED93654
MTQTRTTVFRVLGKDRLSDPWTTFETRFRWQAEQWAEQRAFTALDEDGTPLIVEAEPAGRSCIEWRTGGRWEQYTAWEGPEARYSQIKRVRTEQVQSFRVVIEGQPGVLVGV